MKTDYLVDTNILIYHTVGTQETVDFINRLIQEKSFHVSILTKIEFLGWKKHTPDGLEKCKRLIETAIILPIDQSIADKAIELKRETNIKLADAVIAATAIVNNFILATRNINDFKALKGIEIFNPFT